MNYTQSEIAHVNLHNIYTDLFNIDAIQKQNCIELAELLSKIINCQHSWTWRYIYNLLRGYKDFSITTDLSRALQILANQLDGQSELQSRAREITVKAINGTEEGSVILGHTIRCRQCHIKFVPRSGNGVYCCPEHKRTYYKEQRNAEGNELPRRTPIGVDRN